MTSRTADRWDARITAAPCAMDAIETFERALASGVRISDLLAAQEARAAAAPWQVQS